MAYKWCVVPQCANTSKKTPEKMFVSIPKNIRIRRRWLMLARRNPKDISPTSNVFICEDHFNMKKDMANYMQYKMGFSQTILMVKGVMPSKFEFKKDRRKRLPETKASRRAYTKRLKTDFPSTSTQKDDAKPETPEKVTEHSQTYCGEETSTGRILSEDEQTFEDSTLAPLGAVRKQKGWRARVRYERQREGDSRLAPMTSTETGLHRERVRLKKPRKNQTSKRVKSCKVPELNMTSVKEEDSEIRMKGEVTPLQIIYDPIPLVHNPKEMLEITVPSVRTDEGPVDVVIKEEPIDIYVETVGARAGTLGLVKEEIVHDQCDIDIISDYTSLQRVTLKVERVDEDVV